MRNVHSRMWNMVINLKNVENEKHTRQDQENGNNEKRGKIVMHTIGHGIWRETMKNMENRKCTHYDLEYGKKTEKRGKLEAHMVGPGI